MRCRCRIGLLVCAVGLFAGNGLADIPVFEQRMGVTFGREETMYRVWAPNARSVAVIGDFNGWRIRLTDHLELDRDLGIWSGTIRGSRPRGGYQFLIDGELHRRDPYGRKVSEDETRSVFYDPNDFRWSAARPPRYELEELVIYEMHIGTFNDLNPDDGKPATFDDAIRRLDYLVELGVNTVCVLPVHEFSGSQSWGYDPSDLFAVEQSYGGPEGFKRFVRACHERGLAVHLNIVHNEYGPRNLGLLHFDKKSDADDGGIYLHRRFGIDRSPRPWRVRFGSPMVRRFVRDNVLMWLDEYRVDGFRWDAMVDVQMGEFGTQMLRDINREITERYPGVWSVADNALGLYNFHASWDREFYRRVMPSLTAQVDSERNMRHIRAALTRVPLMWRVVYVGNHREAGRRGEGRRIASDIDADDPGGDYARRLSGLGAVLTFTAPGIPLLFMGNEFQEYGTWHNNTPLDWANKQRHSGTLELHRSLIALRRNREGHSVGLMGRLIHVPVVNDEKKHIVYWRKHEEHPNDQTVVAINFSGSEEVIVVPFPSEGTWMMRMNTDWTMYGGETEWELPRPFTLVAGARAQARMAPYSACIFSLVEQPAAARAPARYAVPEQTQEPRGFKPFSIWRSIHLAGNFNDWSPTAWPFEHVADHTWEGTFFFDQVANPRFRITANEHDAIWWGRPAGREPVAVSTPMTARRLGPEFLVRETWQGLYRFRFDDQTKSLTIERIGDEPLPKEPENWVEPYRAWTSARGASISARLITVGGEWVHLEREDGEFFEVPIHALSLEDRDYVLNWIEDNQ